MITTRHLYGWAKETELWRQIELSLKQALKRSEERYATFDYETDSFVVELKSRPDLSADSYKTWLVPACKLEGVAGKTPVLFYYFGKDKSLWRCDPTTHDQSQWMRHVPSWKSSQVHVWIPREAFTKVECLQTE